MLHTKINHDTILVKLAQYQKLCQFSKKHVEPGSILTLFTEKQYKRYREKVRIYLSKLPEEIIDLIILKTGYHTYINQWGILEYVDWIGFNQWTRFKFLGQGECYKLDDDDAQGYIDTYYQQALSFNNRELLRKLKISHISSSSLEITF